MRGGDRVGLGWRPELAAGILEHLERIDVLEVVAETSIPAGRRTVQALRTLARERPLYVHGVTLGLASCAPVECRRLDALARFVGAVEPAGWSEHLAFVRAGGVEIGHMAMPPRTRANVEAAVANIAQATRIVGAPPTLENIATLIDPPASSMTEPEWTSAIVRGAGVDLLLDLHNLYANALNFGSDPKALLAAMPLDRVECVHLSGGRWIAAPAGEPGRRLLDDHVHDVPEDVYELLALLAARVPRPLTVVLERDGDYPAFPVLLGQMQAARQALARGRRLRLEAA